MFNKITKVAVPLLFVIFLAGCSQSNNTTTYPVTNTNTTTTTMTVPSQINQDLAKQYSGATIVTNFGNIQIKFYADAPITVSNFLTLAQKNFYDGTLFHRVIKGFMIQGGDPNSKNADWSTHGQGGPGYQFSDEPTNHKLVRGSLAMANAGPNTNGSQFFIVTAPATAWLDGHYNNFGEVVSGMDVVDKIEAVKTNANDHPLSDVKILKVELIK